MSFEYPVLDTIARQPNDTNKTYLEIIKRLKTKQNKTTTTATTTTTTTT